jgi:hypothetical protein
MAGTFWSLEEVVALLKLSRHMEHRSNELRDGEIDALLLKTTAAQWSKVAFIIARTMFHHKVRDENRLGNRIIALIESGQLESKGNVQNWRYSEVRLPSKA